MIDLEKMDADLEWIERAMEDPSYLLIKGDNSNMFELSCDDEGYVRYAIEELEAKGYKVSRNGRFISLQKRG